MVMVGGAGARAAAVRRKRVQQANLAEKRKSELEKQKEEVESKMTKLFNQYDTNGSGKLEKDQVQNLLTDMDFSTPEGTPPSDEELNFILKIADRSGDGCMDRSELQTALIVWKTFTKGREQLEETLKKYDKSETGKLEKPELKAYLTELNDGKEPSDEEVDWVLSEADFMGDGAIHTTELVMATQSWYSYEASNPSAAPAASSTETSAGAKEPSATACCSIS